MTYAVIYEKPSTGYSAYVADLPGCVTTGRTRAETRRLMKEAIEFHLAGMREDAFGYQTEHNQLDWTIVNKTAFQGRFYVSLTR